MSVARAAVVILAAGLSRRAGSFKPLLPLGGQTIADYVGSTFLQNCVDVYLVVGHRQSEVSAGVSHPGIIIIENPDYRLGMFSSVQAGLRRLDSDHERFFIMPGDIPLVRPASIARLLAEGEHCADKIVYPVFAGRRGHPPLIPSGLIPSILGWEGDGGLKGALSAHHDRSIEVALPDGNILFDVDTPEDYTELKSRFRRLHVPTDAECDAIMGDICRVNADIRRHCARVAEVAVCIADALIQAGRELDRGAIRAAALLHDVAKGRPDHDAAGGRMLTDMGFARIGAIVVTHTDLPRDGAGVLFESKIVYLADKMVEGTRLVTIGSRYQSARDRFARTPDIASEILQREERVLSVKREFELILGHSLETVIASLGDGPSG